MFFVVHWKVVECSQNIAWNIGMKEYSPQCIVLMRYFKISFQIYGAHSGPRFCRTMSHAMKVEGSVYPIKMHWLGCCIRLKLLLIGSLYTVTSIRIKNFDVVINTTNFASFLDELFKSKTLTVISFFARIFQSSEFQNTYLSFSYQK